MNAMKFKPAGIMFDMDGLLLDTERLCMECFVDTQKAFGLLTDKSVFLQCVGLRGEESSHVIRNYLPERIEPKAFSDVWGARIKERMELSVPRKHGAKRLLLAIRANGLSTGVVTSTKTESARNLLQKSGLLDLIEVVIGGDQVSEGKPDPEGYLALAKGVGVKASDCLAFEDSDAGAMAAIAAGATTIIIPDLIAPSEEVKAKVALIAPDLLTAACTLGLIQDTSL